MKNYIIYIPTIYLRTKKYHNLLALSTLFFDKVYKKIPAEQICRDFIKSKLKTKYPSLQH